MYNYSMFLLKVHYFINSKLGNNIHNKYIMRKSKSEKRRFQKLSLVPRTSARHQSITF